jgi:cell division protease FtsH
MSEKLGPQTFGDANHEVFLGRDFSANADYSPEVAYEIDKEIARLIDEAYEKARTILTERKGQLDLMADVLVERETVDREELEALLDNKWAEFLAQEEAKKGSDEGPGTPEIIEEETPEAEGERRAPEPPRPAPPVLGA